MRDLPFFLLAFLSYVSSTNGFSGGRATSAPPKNRLQRGALCSLAGGHRTHIILFCVAVQPLFSMLIAFWRLLWWQFPGNLLWGCLLWGQRWLTQLGLVVLFLLGAGGILLWPMSSAWAVPLFVPSLRMPQILLQMGSLPELQQHQQTIQQYQQRLSQEKQRLQNLERQARGNVQSLRRHIQATTAQVQQTREQLQQTKQRLQQMQANLLQAEQRYEQKRRAVVARFQFLQRQQRRRGLSLLLQSQSLNEFFDRQYQLKRVYQVDRQVLAALKLEADALKQQRRQIEGSRNQMALLNQRLLAQQANFQGEAQAQVELVERLQIDQTALEAALEQLAKDSAELSQLIQKRAAEQRAQALAGGQPFLQGTGRMVVPTDGPLTSGFGWRMHPILGYERFHGGLDFGADYGAVIRAADSGGVLLAGWYGGFGYTVIVDHGNGLTTLYAHSSEVLVTEGQPVQRGQTIATVGSTGLSTGPHLHFEVRRDGEPIDPLPFL